MSTTKHVSFKQPIHTIVWIEFEDRYGSWASDGQRFRSRIHTMNIKLSLIFKQKIKLFHGQGQELLQVKPP